MEERIYRYPRGNLIADYARTVFGLGCTAAPAVSLPLGSTAQMVLVALALMFLAFGLRTVGRQRMRVSVSDREIAQRPGAAALCWQDLTSVRLAYYSTRRDRQRGWMQLTLRARNRALCIDSCIEGFGDIAQRAAVAADTNRLALNTVSLANFESLGISLSPGPSLGRGTRCE